MSGVECGPAPCEKSSPSVGAGYVNSHTVVAGGGVERGDDFFLAPPDADSMASGRYMV